MTDRVSVGRALEEDGVFPVWSCRPEGSQGGGDSHQELPRRQQEYAFCRHHLPSRLYGNLRLGERIQAKTG